MFFTPYLKELQLLIRNFTEWAILLIIFIIFFFSFGLKEVLIFGKIFSFPLPMTPSFATQLFNYMTTDLMPEGVTLIVTNPLAAFVAQIKIALLLAFIFTLPFFLYRLIQYFAPALYIQERRSVLKVAVPSSLLFALGAAFSYFVIIPPTFSLLYTYTENISAIPYFAVGEFVSIVLALIFATGLMFLLPVVMILLSRFGIVKPYFWQTQWRYALLFFLIVSAIITPDGSGVTMMLLSIPMAGLYGVGCIFSRNAPSAVNPAETH